MKVSPVTEKDYPAFENLFCDYYEELDCEDEPLHLFREYVLPDLKANLFEAAAVLQGETLAGFIIFQTDDVLNDWNFKEGCGDVRELYVCPAARRQGLGSALLSFAEARLWQAGVKEIYTLPTEESEKFFINRGYTDTGEYCPEADNKVFGKTHAK